MSTYNISICYWYMFDLVHILMWTLYSSYVHVCTAWNYVRDNYNILPQTFAAIVQCYHGWCMSMNKLLLVINTYLL